MQHSVALVPPCAPCVRTMVRLNIKICHSGMELRSGQAITGARRERMDKRTHTHTHTHTHTRTHTHTDIQK